MRELQHLTAPGPSPGTLPSLPPREAALVRSLMEVEGRPAFPRALMPNDADRASIASQIAGIERGLRPGSRQEIVGIIAVMLLAFPSTGSADEETQGARLDVYAGNVSDLPVWAVKAACEKLMHGKGGGKPGFTPSAAEVRKLADEAIAPHRALIIKLERVLAAKPLGSKQTPEERQRIGVKMANLARGIAEAAKGASA